MRRCRTEGKSRETPDFVGCARNIGIRLCAVAGPRRCARRPDRRQIGRRQIIDKDGNPTFEIGADGTVDWYTYSGYRRYHSECHVCHGPDGEGSSYAPALKDSLKRINYGEFLGIVAGGRRNVSTSQGSVMPAFGTNPTRSCCYIDDLYVYLRARANDVMGRVRPEKREARTCRLHQGGGRLFRRKADRP